MRKLLLPLVFAALTPALLDAQENPLLSPSGLPYGMPRFSEIKPSDFAEGFQKSAEQRRTDAARINAVPLMGLTYENTVVALESAGSHFGMVNSVYNLMGRNMGSADMRRVSNELTATLNSLDSKVVNNTGVMRRLESLYDKRAEAGLTPERIRVLEYLKPRGGRVADDEADEGRDSRPGRDSLSGLKQRFKNNINASNDSFFFLVGSLDSLKGIPQPAIDAARAAAARAGFAGKWAITYSAYRQAINTAENRDLRRRLYEAYQNRCPQNEAMVLQLVNQRLEQAKAAGFKCYFDMTSSRNMVGSGEMARHMLTSLTKTAFPKTNRDYAEIQEIARKTQGKDFVLSQWDYFMYNQDYRQGTERGSVNALARPYLSLGNAQNAFFYAAGRLFGLKFEERPDIVGWVPEVKAWDVRDKDGSHLGVLMADYFVRAGKENNGGGWCSGFSTYPGPGLKPVQVMVINFGFQKPPQGDNPQLGINDVQLVFHECGHALRGFFINAIHPAARGTLPFDAGEFHSEMMETWATQPELLRVCMKHFQTGAPMPEEIIDEIIASEFYGPKTVPAAPLLQAILDMEWSSITEPYTGTVKDFEAAVAAKYGYAAHRELNNSHFFTQALAGPYAGQYYAYAWCRVLQKDAFGVFEGTGDMFDAATADRLRRYMYQDEGLESAMKQYIKFRGSDPAGSLYDF